jgi:hypothetical protein
METRHGTEVEKNAKLKAERRDIAAELTPSAFGKALGRLQFDDDSSLDEHVDAVKADLFTTEHHDNRVLPINSKPSISQRDPECSRINRLHEAVPQLVVDLKKTSYDGVAELLLDDDGTGKRLRPIRVIRFHSSNSGSQARGPATQIFQPGADSPEIREEP